MTPEAHFLPTSPPSDFRKVQLWTPGHTRGQGREGLPASRSARGRGHWERSRPCFLPWGTQMLRYRQSSFPYVLSWVIVACRHRFLKSLAFRVPVGGQRGGCEEGGP